MIKEIVTGGRFGMGKILPLYLLLAVICLGSLMGCKDKARENASEQAPMAKLEQLAPEYWTKRFLEKDYAATYEMEAEKGSMSFKEYVIQISNSGNIRYLDVAFKEAKVEGDRAQVSLSVTIQLPMISKEIKMPKIDSWVLKSDGWKHVFSKGKTQVSPGGDKQ